MGKMEILGIDLSHKSTEELHKIGQHIGSLSEQAVKMIKNYDKEETIRRNWFENPEETPLTDNDVEMICISHMNHDLKDPLAYFPAHNGDTKVWALQVPETIEYPNMYAPDELTLNMGGVEHGGGDYVVCPDKGGAPDLSKMKAVNGVIFDSKYAADYEKLPLKHLLFIFNADTAQKIDQMDKDAIAEAMLDKDYDMRIFTHFDTFYDAFEKAYPETPTYVIQALTENVTMHGIGQDQYTFMNSCPNAARGLVGQDKDVLMAMFSEQDSAQWMVGGKLVFDQPNDIKENLGKYLQTKISDIVERINDDFGSDVLDGRAICVTPTVGDTSKKFVVTFNPTYEKKFETISNAIRGELADKGYSDIKAGRIYPLTSDELQTAQESYSESALGLDMSSVISKYSKEMKEELAHAEKVLANGFDDDGYNEDGFDETGHSKDGEYDSRYDKSFTDDGPDF